MVSFIWLFCKRPMENHRHLSPQVGLAVQTRYISSRNAQLWLGRVTHMNELCHTYTGGMPHVWIVVSRIWMRHVVPVSFISSSILFRVAMRLRINKPCHTYEWAMLQIRMRHVAHMDEPCHSYEWVRSHQQVLFRAAICPSINRP